MRVRLRVRLRVRVRARERVRASVRMRVGVRLGVGKLGFVERVEHTLELGARLHALDPRRRGGGVRLVLVTGKGYGLGSGLGLLQGLG